MTTKPEYLTPWCCPKCGADCSGQADQTKDTSHAVGYMLTCKCGCEFIHWENITYVPCCVEVGGEEYEYPAEKSITDVSSAVDEYQDIADAFGDRWYVRCRDSESGRIYGWWASPRFKRKIHAQTFLDAHQPKTLFEKEKPHAKA